MNLRFELALPNESFSNFRGLTISLQQNDFFYQLTKWVELFDGPVHYDKYGRLHSFIVFSSIYLSSLTLLSP